ncbi:MAG: peroxidase family protein, partial [Wenzhouxiangellaceae bacterium]|nr:peroxidase family protein [Wenzhouxiangellaceae bacterium]
RIAAEAPGLSGDAIYEEARARVGAMLQVITYEQFLPLLLGDDALPEWSGYDDGVDPTLANVFSTVAYRLGHSMVTPQLARLNGLLLPVPDGPLALRDAFFAPEQMERDGAVAELMRGAAMHTMQSLDRWIVDDLRNFLFGPPGSGGFDLGALNLQRARDHGIPDYNAVRAAYGLAPASSFSDITTDPALADALAGVYGSVDDIDPWIGGLAEDRAPGRMVGPLLQAILVEQFVRLRDGDRFWYRNIFSGEVLEEIESTRLVDVVRRNSEAGSELPADLFRGGVTPFSIPVLGPWGLVLLALVLLMAAPRFVSRAS